MDEKILNEKSYNSMSEDEKKNFEAKLRSEAKALSSYVKPATIVSSVPKGEMLAYDSKGENRNLKRLEEIMNEMSKFNQDVNSYMKSLGAGDEKQVPVEKEREITELEPVSFKNLWGILKRESITKKVIVTEYETKIIPRDDYDLNDLKKLVHTAVEKLEQFNRELDQYKENIGQTVDRLLHTRNSYIDDEISSNIEFEASKAKIVKLEKLISEYQAILRSTKGTDKKKATLEKELAGLEIRLIEAKSDFNISGETSQVKNNYKDILRAYSIILGDTKEEARRWVSFISHFVQGVTDTDITMGNVYQVCKYIAESCGIMGETVGHMRFLATKLGQLYNVVHSGKGPETVSPIQIDAITHEIESKNQQKDQYRQVLEQKMEILINPLHELEKDYIVNNAEEVKVA